MERRSKWRNSVAPGGYSLSACTHPPPPWANMQDSHGSVSMKVYTFNWLIWRYWDFTGD